jgi:hypothetical protein
MPSFNKSVEVFFEKLLKGFDDQLVASGLASIVTTDQVRMARANDVFWRPNPYIGVSFNGSDATSNFGAYTQMASPAAINTRKHAPFQMSDTELRDALQEERLVRAMSQKLASDINYDVLNAAVTRGTLFVKRSGAASGFDDAAQCDAIMNEQGVPALDRRLVLSSRDYNSAASNLVGTARSLDNSISSEALRRAYVGDLASFSTFKLDYAINKTAAAGGGSLTASTTYTAGGSGNYHLPASVDSNGANVDNRVQTITISSTTNVAAGDSFTIANVFSCHRVTKQSTGQLKTFKVISVPSSTTLVISPPIINSQGTSLAEKAYGNVVVSSQSGTAAIVFLNTVTGPVNPFFVKDAVEIYPGRIEAPSGQGVEIMRSTTETGFELVLMKGYDINTGMQKVRVDTLYGVGVPLPEHCGGIMFSQT